MHRATDKMGMAVKMAMVEHPEALEWTREELLGRLRVAVDRQEWVDAEMCMAILWLKEWCQFLGRDFTLYGNDPEHVAVKRATMCETAKEGVSNLATWATAAAMALTVYHSHGAMYHVIDRLIF